MINFDFYVSDYHGQKIQDLETFTQYESIACDDINNLSRGLVEDINTLSASISLLVKKAVCCQIDYLFDNGISKSSVSSVGLGKFNYSLGGGNIDNHYDNRAYSLLERTGFLFRGVSC